MVTCRNGSALSEPRKLKWFRKQGMNFSHVVSTNIQYILRRNSLCLQGRLNKVFYIIYNIHIYIYIFSTIQNFKVHFYHRRFLSDISDFIVTSLHIVYSFSIYIWLHLVNSRLTCDQAQLQSETKIEPDLGLIVDILNF